MKSAQPTAKIALLIDDLPTAAEIQTSLEAMGYAVVHTPTSGSAARLLDPSVNVILVDLDLDEALDAFAIQKYASSPGSASVIFLADDAKQIARLKAEARGCGWVERPFHPIELFFEIQIALEKQSPMQPPHVERADVPSAALA
jgi:DNA-binding response OmpR family regulator